MLSFPYRSFSYLTSNQTIAQTLQHQALLNETAGEHTLRKEFDRGCWVG